eukprot:COSAG06_NODE_2090_length_7612_cov_4.185678_3_plen_48_part_00
MSAIGINCERECDTIIKLLIQFLEHFMSDTLVVITHSVPTRTWTERR